MMNSVEIIVLNVTNISQTIINILGRVPNIPSEEHAMTATRLRDTFQYCHDGLSAVAIKLTDIAMMLVRFLIVFLVG